MINEVSKDLLIQGSKELYDRSKISLEVKTAVENYLDTLSTQFYKTIEYSDFNQDDSVGCTFTDNLKTVTWDSGTAELLTNKISISPSTLKTIKLKSTDQNVTFQISYNGTKFYNINDYDISENISSDFYLKVLFTQTNTIKGIVLVYEK